VFGYITVLPGAFSAYRYIALQNNERGEGPLQKYFLGETLVRSSPLLCRHLLNVRSTGLAPTSLLPICIWLRIVCVGKHDVMASLFLLRSFIHRFYVGNSCRNVKERGFFTMSSRRTPLPTRLTRCAPVCLGSRAELDHLLCQVPELVSQRRRWLNGSFFAAIHGTVKFHYIYRSSHTFWRKFWIHVELIYQTFNLIFSWFALVRLPRPFMNFLTGTLV
jgi:cellulose synthase/poly-beta-1,6-N-acetylglucosamine synthase-like glycosyltransferase